jgi:hypothetical protein
MVSHREAEVVPNRDKVIIWIYLITEITRPQYIRGVRFSESRNDGIALLSESSFCKVNICNRV